MLAAIVIIQLYESLSLGSIFGTNASLLPVTHNMVAFGWQLFQQVDSLILILLHAVLVAILEEQWHPGIDDKHVDKRRTDLFFLARRRFVELEMVVPIGGSAYVEKLLKLSDIRCFQQMAEEVARLAYQLSKLADTQGRISIGVSEAPWRNAA